MKSNNNYSEGYANYLKNIKREKVKVLLIQIALLVGILVLWEILANAGIIQTFLFSKPSDIYKLFIKYISNGELARHVGISVYETVLGLVIGTVLGILVAIALWWSEKLSKILVISLCIMMMTTLLSGCSKKQQEQINFFNYGENIDDETIKEFEKKYNIKVNMETFDDMEAMYQKINSGAGQYDVVLVSDALMPRMIEKGLVQELNKENIPNISQMDEQYLNLDMDPGNKYSVPYMFGTVGLIYNKDVVKEKVDSWDILWNEKYKDQIFMFDTYRDTIGVALKKLGYSLNSTNKDEINEAKELLLEQRKLINPIYGVDNGTTMIPAGETNINMIWSGEGLNLQDEYPNLVYIVPKEGANFWIDSLCITSNAKNVEGAEKFINFVSDKESALRIADEIGYTTPNKEARLAQPKEIQDNPNAYMTKEIMSRCELYKDFDLKTKQMYDDAWTAIKIDNN